MRTALIVAAALVVAALVVCRLAWLTVTGDLS